MKTEETKLTITELECMKIEKKTVESDKGEVTTYKYIFEGEHALTITSTIPLDIKRGQEFTARFIDPQTTLEAHDVEGEE